MTATTDLAKLVELAEKATPGPWWPDYQHTGNRMWPGIECSNPPAHRNYLLRMFAKGKDHSQQWNDMNFICEARNAIPALSALLQEHARVVGALRKIQMRCQDSGDISFEEFAGEIFEIAEEASGLEVETDG